MNKKSLYIRLVDAQKILSIKFNWRKLKDLSYAQLYKVVYTIENEYVHINFRPIL